MDNRKKITICWRLQQEDYYPVMKGLNQIRGDHLLREGKPLRTTKLIRMIVEYYVKHNLKDTKRD